MVILSSRTLFFFFFCLADRQPSKKIQRSLIQPRYISVRTIRYTIVFTDYSPVYVKYRIFGYNTHSFTWQNLVSVSDVSVGGGGLSFLSSLIIIVTVVNFCLLNKQAAV